MKILVDIRHLADKHKTGVGEYTTELLRALFEIDRENDYVLFSSGMQHIQTDFSPVRIDLSRDAMKATWKHVRLPNKLLKLTTYFTGRPYLTRLEGGDIDLVFLPNLNFTAIPPTIPYILTIHDLSWHISPEFLSWKMRLWHHGTRAAKLVSGAASIIVPSNSVKDDVVRIFKKSPDLVHVIPHGVDPIFSPTQQPQDHGVRSRLKLPKHFALFVGTLEPRKNILTIIQAIETYRHQTGDNLHLVLAGTLGWKSNSIRERLRTCEPKNLRTSRWLHHLGYIRSEDRPALYRAAQVFVWPSHYEGFGLPVLEAMASGIPVITSATTSLPEITGNAAILIDPHDPNNLVTTLKQTLSSPSLRTTLGTKGLDRAKQFTWRTSAEQTLRVFKNIFH